MGPSGGIGDDRARRARVDRLIERDRDVGAERLLDPDRDLRREPVGGSIEVAAERDPVLIDDAQIAQRNDLEPSGVGQDRAVPGH